MFIMLNSINQKFKKYLLLPPFLLVDVLGLYPQTKNSCIFYFQSKNILIII